MAKTAGENADLWDRASAEVRATDNYVIQVSDDATVPDADEDGFWDAVEARFLALGGDRPPGGVFG